MANYLFHNVLGEAEHKSSRRLNCLTFAALVGFALALALLIWGD